MSLAINWSLLDDQLARALESFLSSRLSDLTASIPNVRNLRISNLAWGSAAPEVTLLDITNPYDDFYWQDVVSSPPPPPPPSSSNLAAPAAASATTSQSAPAPPLHHSSSSSSSPPATDPAPSLPDHPLPRSPTDVQFHVHVAYKGDLTLDVHVDLGAPLPGGGGGSIWLPLHMHLKSMHIDALFALAWIEAGSRVSWCLLECEDESGSTNILKALNIETSVGNASRQVLHNVSKVERFLIDAIHRLLDAECVWPNYHTVILER